MKTLFTKHSIERRRHHRSGTVLALALVAALGVSATEAAADIVAQGRVGNADVRVRLETPDRIIIRAGDPRVDVHYGPYEPVILWRNLSREDHRVAARLSLLSGVHERRLLAERSHGASWKRIARLYDIDRHTLALARSERPLRQMGVVCSDDGYHDHDHDRDRGRGKGKGKGGRW